MQVRTFQGTNTQEVLAQVKNEMGPEAVILSTREFRKNKQRCFEVTAGIEREEVKEEESPAPSSDMPSGFSEWHKEWDRFKSHVYALMQPALNWDQINPHQRLALEHLQNEGVENDVVVDLHHKLTLPEHNGSLLSVLAESVPVEPFGGEAWQQHLHIMLGNNGIGKTISALRMAFLLRQAKPSANIVFINTDSTRANGRLLLRHFTELSGFTAIDAVDKEAVMNAIKDTIEADYVFIDLQALAKNESLVERLDQLGLGQAKQNVACHLCLSPQYTSVQLSALIKQYRTELPTSLVWTKLDECAQYGAIVNIAARSNLPISALSYGAELGNTLCPAQPNLIWRVLLKAELPSRTRNT